MPIVPVSSQQPETPPTASVGALAPVRAGVPRRFARGAVQVAEWKVKRCARLRCTYDTSTTPLLEQSPDTVDQTIRCYWKASARAAYVWVRVRLQASADKGANAPALTVSLVEDDDTEIDLGVAFGEADLIVEREDPETYAPIEVFTAIRSTATPASATNSRLLNVEDNQGGRIAVKAVTENGRIWEIDAWEFVPATVNQTFTT